MLDLGNCRTTPVRRKNSGSRNLQSFFGEVRLSVKKLLPMRKSRSKRDEAHVEGSVNVKKAESEAPVTPSLTNNQHEKVMVENQAGGLRT